MSGFKICYTLFFILTYGFYVVAIKIKIKSSYLGIRFCKLLNIIICCHAILKLNKRPQNVQAPEK
jgi:hypothetical protein